jgi:hypothetical protein
LVTNSPTIEWPTIAPTRLPPTTAAPVTGSPSPFNLYSSPIKLADHHWTYPIPPSVLNLEFR